MRRKIYFICFGLFCCVWALSSAHAHQKNHAITTMVAKSKSLEVMHRFYVHDVEKVVKRQFKKDIDFYKHKEAQDYFGAYLVENFSVRLKGVGPIALSYVGHEIEGKYFWVYQEYLAEVDVRDIEVLNSVLMDALPLQRNLINLEQGKDIKSLSFDKESDWQSFSF